jgi:hypothetical protein
MEPRGEKRPRPSSSAEDRNPRPQKKQFQKLRDARKIAVQSPSPGPSQHYFLADSVVALAAGSIDINAFTAARSFEISALEKAMRSAKFTLA